MKNKRIRTAMTQAAITQTRLARILDIPDPEMSIVLNRYELAVKEQNEIVKKIREWDALRKGETA